MEDKCPKCNETLIIRTISKKIGLDSIDYPVARTCPKCNLNKDLTGAGDIESKPVYQNADEAKSPNSPTSVNSLISIVLAIFVTGAIAWVFFMSPPEEEQAVNPPPAAPAPIINQTPALTLTPALTPTPAVFPEVTASGKRISLRIETQRGIIPNTTTIKPGDEIVWTNEGIYTVTLVSSDSLFEDKLLNNAKRTGYIFKKPGTFTFYLKENKNMTGTIIVES